MVKKFMQGWLGLPEIRSQVDNIEYRLGKIEIQAIQTSATINQMKATLDQFGNFKNQTPAVLNFMEGQIEDLLSAVEALIKAAGTDGALAEAKAMRSRLRNNLTRTRNAQSALQAGG